MNLNGFGFGLHLGFTSNMLTRNTGFIFNNDQISTGKMELYIPTVDEEYIVPFGDGNGNYTPISFKNSTAIDGVVFFSTYSTGIDNNPLPIGINSVPNQTAEDEADITVDRFFQVVPQFSIPNLEADVQLNYTAGEQPSNYLEPKSFSVRKLYLE